MRLKRHLNYKIIFLSIYILAFLSYLLYDLLPAEASSYAIDSNLMIPSIGLTSDVAKVEIEDGTLPTPDTIVGSYSDEINKVFLFGHSSTVFEKLDRVQVGDKIFYDGKEYIITAYNIYAKSEIDMSQLLSSSERNSLVLMTCAGEDYGNGDSSHRLIVSAILH